MTMRPMAQREMMEPGSVASDKSLSRGERASGRGTLRNQSKLRSLDAVLLWPGAMARECGRCLLLSLGLSPASPYSTADLQQAAGASSWVTPLRDGRASTRQAAFWRGGRLCWDATSPLPPQVSASTTRALASHAVGLGFLHSAAAASTGAWLRGPLLRCLPSAERPALTHGLACRSARSRNQQEGQRLAGRASSQCGGQG